MMEIQFAIVAYLWITARADERERAAVNRERELMRAVEKSFVRGVSIGLRNGRRAMIDQINSVLRNAY